jgi:hypothetical protein
MQCDKDPVYRATSLKLCSHGKSLTHDRGSVHRATSVTDERHSVHRTTSLTDHKKTLLTLNEPATTRRIVDRVEVKLDLTTDQ